MNVCSNNIFNLYSFGIFITFLLCIYNFLPNKIKHLGISLSLCLLSILTLFAFAPLQCDVGNERIFVAIICVCMNAWITSFDWRRIKEKEISKKEKMASKIVSGIIIGVICIGVIAIQSHKSFIDSISSAFERTNP